MDAIKKSTVEQVGMESFGTASTWLIPVALWKCDTPLHFRPPVSVGEMKAVFGIQKAIHLFAS